MHWRMVFRKIIPQILVSWAPINMKLSLFDPVFDPIEAHIHGPCAFLFYCSILCCQSVKMLGADDAPLILALCKAQFLL
jgi:hypothetical protein